jgi:hypothetical protein
MKREDQFYTLTMARVYAGQGYFEKAADIYRHLLAREPGRGDLAQALAEAEQAAQENRKSDHDRLVALFVRWFDLTAGRRRIDRLERVLHISKSL